MHNIRQVTFLFNLLFLSIIGCSTTTNKNLSPIPISITQKEKEEANLVALCLSQELTVPESLYNQVLSDLVIIRSSFNNLSESINNIKFTPPWEVSNIIIGFDDITVQKIIKNEYYDWDKLNQKYQVTEIDTKLLDFIGAVILRFNGYLNPHCLVEIYTTLSGVRYVEPNGLIGDYPNIYARQTEKGITYLFRNAWGDCPAGCIYNEYWYFSVEGNQPEFVGYWVRYKEPNEPYWWKEAKLNREQYCEK